MSPPIPFTPSTTDLENAIEAVEGAASSVRTALEEEGPEDELAEARQDLRYALDDLSNEVSSWIGSIEMDFGL